MYFFADFEIYFGLWPLSVSPALGVSVYTMVGQTPALQELAEFRKITTFKGKTQYLINTLSIASCLPAVYRVVGRT